MNMNVINSLSEMGIGKVENSSIQHLVNKEDSKEIKPEDYNKPGKPLMLADADRIAAVELGLVRRANINAKFDVNTIKKNVQRYGLKKYYSIEHYDEYIAVCSNILATIRSGQVPVQSYIIGAPNGFGKSNFANEAIILMNKLNWNCVPFTSLTEIAELWVNTENRLLNAVNRLDYNIEAENDETVDLESSPGVVYKKKPRVILPRYSWSEYINADCLICYFTSFESRNIESRILHRLMIERGTKGLPTIVCISTSLNPYVKDAVLKQHIWDEILLSSKVKRETPARLKHISCFKKIKDPFSKETRKADDINNYDPSKDYELLEEERLEKEEAATKKGEQEKVQGNSLKIDKET